MAVKTVLYQSILAMLPKEPDDTMPGRKFWRNKSGEIMCQTMDDALTIGAFLESLGLNSYVWIYDEDDGEYYGWFGVYPVSWVTA